MNFVLSAKIPLFMIVTIAKISDKTKLNITLDEYQNLTFILMEEQY